MKKEVIQQHQYRLPHSPGSAEARCNSSLSPSVRTTSIFIEHQGISEPNSLAWVFTCCFSQRHAPATAEPSQGLTSSIPLSVNSDDKFLEQTAPKLLEPMVLKQCVDQGCLPGGSFISKRAQANSRPLNELSQYSH